jgi:hypothetical protein
MTQNNGSLTAPCKTIAKLHHLRPVVIFTAYEVPQCVIDYCVDGFAAEPDILVFCGEYFPKIEYILHNAVTRHC